MRTLVALSLAVTSLALVAVGCGGSDDESSSTADWADAFCSTITGWTDDLQATTSEFSDPSNLSQEGLQTATDDIRTSTERLADDLKGLGAPETESGEEITSSLDSLASTLEAESGEITDTVDGISSIADIPSAASTITASLSAMGAAFSETLQTIENADAQGELQAALEDSPECAGIS